jgi:hypothetical protein
LNIYAIKQKTAQNEYGIPNSFEPSFQTYGLSKPITHDEMFLPTRIQGKKKLYVIQGESLPKLTRYAIFSFTCLKLFEVGSKSHTHSLSVQVQDETPHTGLLFENLQGNQKNQGQCSGNWNPDPIFFVLL